MKKIIIINGPNLNLLGKREPKTYGNKSFDSYFKELVADFPEMELTYFQSNVEGEIINKIQETGFSLDGIVLNAGGYTHTSVAIADAIAAIKKDNPNKQAVTDKEIKAFIDKECLKELAKQNFSCYQEYRDSFEGNYSNEARFKEFFKYNQDKLGSTKDVQDFFNSNVRIRFNFLKRKLKDGNKQYIRYENIYKKGGKLGNEVLQGNKDSLKESKIYYDHETKFLQRLNKAEGLSLQAYFSKHGEYPFLNDRDEVSFSELGNETF